MGIFIILKKLPLDKSRNFCLIFYQTFKGSSKNVIPAKAGIQNHLKLLDSRLRGSDGLGIIRGSLKNYEKGFNSRSFLSALKMKEYNHFIFIINREAI
jgi:hypothetical protein